MANKVILVDTSIIIDYFRKSNKKATEFYRLSQFNDFALSTISVFELEVGSATQRSGAFLDALLGYLDIIDLDLAATRLAAQIYRDLKADNLLIGLNDIYIAVTAMAHKLPIATLNRKHFVRIQELELVDWLPLSFPKNAMVKPRFGFDSFRTKKAARKIERLLNFR